MDMHIYLIRHGQTEWNKIRRIQGQLDVPLNDTGIRQAQQLGGRVSAIPLDAIYSSDLQRARQTAEEIRKYHTSCDYAFFQDLRERFFGSWEGLYYEQIQQMYPDFYAGVDFGGKFGIETYDAMLERGLKALNVIVAKHLPGQHVAVISHGALLNALLYHLSGGEHGTGKSKLNNTCFNHVSFRNEEWRVHLVNDFTHLDMEC
jgi:broad specificity phosphatase PhoE